MADLFLHPFEIEFAGEQQDRDVGAPEAVWRDVRQRGHPQLLHSLGSEHRGFADDFADGLAGHLRAAFVLEEGSRRARVVAGSGEPADVLDECFG
ncbi:MAG: hypothetical protein WA484_16720 [Solirubrobacteraceae bacterium]